MSEQRILPQAEPAGPPEKGWLRSAVRFRFDQEAYCYSTAFAGYVPRWGIVQNISAGGIGLLLSVQLKPGTRLVIETIGTDVSASVALPARIRHCTQQAEDRWIAGCEFINRLSDEQLQALLRTGTATSPDPMVATSPAGCKGQTSSPI